MGDKNVIYKEKQSFHDYVTYAFLLLSLIGIAWIFGHAVYAGKFSVGMAFLCLSLIGLIGFELWYLKNIRLILSINDKYIKLKKRPIPYKEEKIYWDNVKECSILSAPKGSIWFGNNINFGRIKKYSLSGRNGLSIITNDGTRYILGSQNVDLLKEKLLELNLGNNEKDNH